MNRVLGDYFETLLYKIFVSIDEHTTVAEVIITFLGFIVKHLMSSIKQLLFLDLEANEIRQKSKIISFLLSKCIPE
jgi:hypothetical protein